MENESDPKKKEALMDRLYETKIEAFEFAPFKNILRLYITYVGKEERSDISSTLK